MKKQYDKKREFNYDYDGAWVLRKGLFYGCDYADHDIIAVRHLGYSTTELLEKTGAARLKGSLPFFMCTKHYSDEQIKTIIHYYKETGAFYALRLFYEELKRQGQDEK